MSDPLIHPDPVAASDFKDTAEPQYRTAPHNVEAEQELLGAILVNNEAASKVNSSVAKFRMISRLQIRWITTNGYVVFRDFPGVFRLVENSE